MIEEKKRQEYQTINGCTKQFQCEQIFWGLSATAIIAIYSIFTVPPILRWPSMVMIVFMAIVYLLCLIMIYDYCLLTMIDPVDERLKGNAVDGETKLCSKCDMQVGLKTYHCIKCMRCTDELDHHNMLVNNCISLKNLRNYIRMNVCFTLATGGISAESLVIFVYTFFDSTLGNLVANKWIVLAVGVGAFIGFPVAVANIFSSCYIRFSKGMPRIEYIYREKGSNHSQIESSQKISSADSVSKHADPWRQP